MPASQKPVGTDKEGTELAEQWSYLSVVGMLLYLAANPWPEFAYAVHHCTQFTHNLKASHGNAVKRICQYLKETQMKGMLLHSRHELTIDCFVDVDSAEQWNVKDPHDPLCVKSQLGYVANALPIGFLNYKVKWHYP